MSRPVESMSDLDRRLAVQLNLMGEAEKKMDACIRRLSPIWRCFWATAIGVSAFVVVSIFNRSTAEDLDMRKLREMQERKFKVLDERNPRAKLQGSAGKEASNSGRNSEWKGNKNSMSNHL